MRDTTDHRTSSPSITYARLRAYSESNFQAVHALAESRKPGCVAARKAIRYARQFGLDSKPYIVRESMMYGWSGSGRDYAVAPLRGADKPRGGARAGAGRPATDAATGLIRKQVMLDPASIAALTARGDGNLSLGIRRAAVAGC